jgi:hypothetical protein
LLSEKLTDLQHKHSAAILSTLHVHLDHENCLEVVLVRGKSSPTLWPTSNDDLPDKPTREYQASREQQQ